MLNPAGLSPAQTDGLFIEEIFSDINVMALPIKLLNEAIDGAITQAYSAVHQTCNLNETTQKACDVAGSAISTSLLPVSLRAPAALAWTASQFLPEQLTALREVAVVANVIQEAVRFAPEYIRGELGPAITSVRDGLADHFFTLGIPKKTTIATMESLALLSTLPIGSELAALPAQLRALSLKVKLLPEIFSQKAYLKRSFIERNHIFISDRTHGKFTYGYMMREDGALRVFVEGLYARQPKKSAGLAIKALREVKELGQKVSATKIQLQFIPNNKDLFEVVKKNYPYLGKDTAFPPHNILRDVRTGKATKAPVFLLTENRLVKQIPHRATGMATALVAGKGVSLVTPIEASATQPHWLKSLLGDIKQLRSQAKGYYEQKPGDYEKALACFQEVVKQNPKDFEAYWYIGQCFRNLPKLPKHQEQALKAFVQSEEAFIQSDFAELPKSLTQRTLSLIPTVTGDLELEPRQLKNSALTTNIAVGDHGVLGGTFVPTHPERSTLNATTNLGGVITGLQANPLNPKASQLVLGTQVTGLGFTAQIPLKEPLKTKFSVQVPIKATPFTVSVQGQLNHLEKLRFKVEMPLGEVSRLTKYVGIKLQSVPIASIRVVTVFKHPKKILHKISRWHKKKKHRHRDYSYLLRPLTLEEMARVFFSQINQSDRELLTSCRDLLRELCEFEKNSQLHSTVVTAQTASLTILQDIVKQLEGPLSALEKETALLQQQVKEIEKGHSLVDATDNLKNLNQALNVQTEQLRQNSNAAVQVLKTKITPQMAAQFLTKLKK